MEIHPVGAKSFHADRWMDMMKFIFTFCSFAEAPKDRNLCLNKPLGNFEDFKLI